MHEVKEANKKRLHTARFQIYDILKKAQPGAQGREEGMNRWNPCDFQCREAILYNTVMVYAIIHLSNPIECATQRVNPNVNYDDNVSVVAYEL